MPQDEKKRQKSCGMMSKKKVHKVLMQLGKYQIVVFGYLICTCKKNYDGFKICNKDVYF